MEYIPEYIRQYAQTLQSHAWLPYVAGSAAAVIGVRLLLKLRKGKETVTDPDTVVLHQFGRGPYAPSLGPFPVKLETYLRMAKIPYKNDLKGVMSKKNKIPWITYNGEDIADSQFCIEFLNKKRQVDLNAQLTDQNKAIARAFQKMVEENTYWTLSLQMWVYSEKEQLVDLFTSNKMLGFLLGLALPLFRRRLSKQAYSQGMGRHNQSEVLKIMEDDMRAISIFLGEKPFLMGDEPCETDCSVFGMLAHAYWHSDKQVPSHLVKQRYTNLGAYCERMKQRFWPDWDAVITRPEANTK